MSGGAGGVADDSIEELKGLVMQTLESKGVLQKMRAQLRASVFTAVREQPGGVYGEPKGPAPPGASSPGGQLIREMIKEYCEFYSLDNSLQVLDCEAQLGDGGGVDGPADTKALAAQAGLPASRDTGRPLLEQLLAAYQSGTAVAHPPAVGAEPASTAAAAADAAAGELAETADYTHSQQQQQQLQQQTPEGKRSPKPDAGAGSAPASSPPSAAAAAAAAAEAGGASAGGGLSPLGVQRGGAGPGSLGGSGGGLAPLPGGSPLGVLPGLPGAGTGGKVRPTAAHGARRLAGRIAPLVHCSGEDTNTFVGFMVSRDRLPACPPGLQSGGSMLGELPGLGGSAPIGMDRRAGGEPEDDNDDVEIPYSPGGASSISEALSNDDDGASYGEGESCRAPATRPAVPRP
eukprot:SAG22_NODE_680_length_7934_cov_5.365539_5_plen_403_part_00